MSNTSQLLEAAALTGALFPATAGAAPDHLSATTAVDWDHAPHDVVGPRVPFAEEDGPHTIYVNFDGVTLTEGYPDNARDNVTSLTGMGGTYVSSGIEPDDPTREQILNEVRQDYAGMWVEVTDQRPAGGQYTMIVVSPTNKGPSQNGVASLNCGGSPLGVGFAFFSAGSGSVDVIATTISHEAAHTFGIEHVDNTDDIMYWSSVSISATFVDACTPIDEATPLCVEHESLCPPGQSNTYQELAELFGGPIDPDGTGPSVELVAPVEGERFAIGEEIVILAEASDDISVTQVRLEIDGELAGTKLTPPYEWIEAELEEGLHEIHVIARDTGGNETTSLGVTVAVGDVELPDPMPEDPPNDDGGGSDSGGPLPPDLDSDVPQQGCGCSSRTSDGLGFGLSLFIAAIAATDRRKRGARR